MCSLFGDLVEQRILTCSTSLQGDGIVTSNGENREELSKYDEVILRAFQRHYQEGSSFLEFSKDELNEICLELGIVVRNIPDIVYTFRSRRRLPKEIRKTGHWAIAPAGHGTYAFQQLANPPHFEIPFGDYTPIDIYKGITYVSKQSGDSSDRLPPLVDKERLRQGMKHVRGYFWRQKARRYGIPDDDSPEMYDAVLIRWRESRGLPNPESPAAADGQAPRGTTA